MSRSVHKPPCDPVNKVSPQDSENCESDPNELSHRILNRTNQVRHSRRRLRHDEGREQQISRTVENKWRGGCCLHRLVSSANHAPHSLARQPTGRCSVEQTFLHTYTLTRRCSLPPSRTPGKWSSQVNDQAPVGARAGIANMLSADPPLQRSETCSKNFRQRRCPVRALPFCLRRSSRQPEPPRG